jgi:hypothetical protein
MAYATRRSYAGAAPACTLTNDIASGDTSLSITGTTTNWPSTANGPFFMVIDPGLATEEKVLVASRTSGSLSTVTRGVDGTVAAAHSAGATCYPVFTAVDADQANKIASTLTTKGDILVTDGSLLNRLAVGTNEYSLVADSVSTNGVKWSQVQTAGIASDAVTTAKIDDEAVTTAKIDDGAVTGAKLAATAAIQPTIVDAKGDIIAATADNTVTRVAVGSNGQVLTADSVETAGVKWATPTPSAITAVASATVLTSQTTTSTSFTDLATAGPSVTLTTGTEALVTISAILGQGADAGQVVHAGVAVSGASTIAASTSYSLFLNGDDFTSSSGNVSLSTTFKMTGLVAGSNTFTMKYITSSSTARFENRHLTVFAI